MPRARRQSKKFAAGCTAELQDPGLPSMPLDFELRPPLLCLFQADARPPARFLRNELHAGILKGLLNFPYRVCRPSYLCRALDSLEGRGAYGCPFGKLRLIDIQEGPSSSNLRRPNHVCDESQLVFD